MLGAIIGDIVGSIYEFNNYRSKVFNFFSPSCFFTDDSVMTFAVFEALNKVDNNILKLDTIDEEYILKVDRPTGHYDLQQIIECMKKFKGNLIIQTMFMKGKDVDNTSDSYVLPWLETIREIAPRQVMIYTIDRETPDQTLEKATHEELDRIGELIKQIGIPVSISY